MKVLLLSFYGTVGTVYYVTPLSTALSKTGVADNIVVCLPDYARLEKLNTGTGLLKFAFPRRLPMALLKALDPFFYRHLLQQIDLLSPDIIHITHELRVPFFFAIALHQKYPVVTTIHEPRGIQHTVLRSTLLNPIHEANTRFIIKSSDKIIVHGENHKRCLLAKNVPSHKISVIPHGPFAPFTPPKDEWGKGSGQNVLFFGVIRPSKGLEYLVQAGKIIQKHCPQVTITIAGEGNLDPYRPLIGDDDRFVIDNRFIPDDDAAVLFQKAYVVVLPYSDGSQSGIISIAGSFKKPVVVTNVGNFSEMVEDGKTGFIVPPRDANALAEAIIKLLSDDELRRVMGENAFKAVREGCSWHYIARRTLEVYKEASEAWHKV